MAVDDKIVSVKFDNASFERKMSETIASLDKLRTSLDMVGAQKGLSNLGAAAKGVNMEPLAVSVEGISAKFLAMSTIAITALSGIVTKAAQSGAAMLNSFSMGPIIQGFQEYELKMGSIQTILSNTSKAGTTLDDVTASLDKLNTYADKTIYNFGDMTKNIGLFTNAGIGIEDATSMIKGFSNEAASSGTNAEGAAAAAYQLSQALSTGTIRLMDWKSLSNVGMGNKNMQNGLIEVADAMGTLNKNGTNATEIQENFNASLEKNWLSADVMSSYLKIMAGDMDAAAMSAMGLTDEQIAAFEKQQQMSEDAATKVRTFTQLMGTVKEAIGSGWSETFSTVFGDFNEATDLFTGFNDMIGGIVGRSSEMRNTLLKDWAALDGRKVLFSGLIGGLTRLGAIFAPIKEAFRDIFPRKTAQELADFSWKFAELMGKIEYGEGTAKKVGDAFRGFFALLSIGWEIIKGVAKVFFAVGKAIWTIFSPLLNLVSGTGNLITGLHGMLVEGEGVSSFFDGFIGLIEGVADAVAGVVSAIVDFVAGLGLIEKAANIIQKPMEMLQSAGDAIKDFFTGSKEGANETNKTLATTAGFFDRLIAALQNVFRQMGEFFGDLGGFVGGALGGIIEAFGDLGGAIADALGTGNFSNVLNIIKTGLLGGILAVLVKFFRNGLKLDFGQGALVDKLKDMVESAKNVLDTLTSSLKSMQANIRADTLVKIAIAMGILAVATIALSLVKPEALAKAMAAIAVGFGQMTAVMLALEKASAGGGALKIIAMAGGMVLLAAAMALLVIPIMILGKMDMKELAQGLVGVTVAMFVMSEAIYRMGEDPRGLIKAAISMGIMSLALILLGVAVKKFAEIGVVDMAVGLGSAAIGITLLLKALERMPKDFEKKAGGMILLVIALRGLAKIVEIFAAMSIAQLATGFLSIALGLQMIGIAMDEFPDDMLEKAAAMIILSGALFVLGLSIEKVGSLPWDTLLKGVLSLSVMLGVLAIALILMEETERGALALVAASVGLLLFGHVIEQVGSLPFQTLIQGVYGIIGVLAVLAIASLAAPGILLLGLGLMAIGAGFMFIGVGAAAAGKGLELAAKYGREGLGHLMDAMYEFIRAIPSLGVAIIQGFIDGFVELGKRVPEIVEVLKEIMIALLEAIQDMLPEIGDTISAFIDEALEVFEESIPDFIDAGTALIMNWLKGMAENAEQFVVTVSTIINEFLEAFTEEIPELVENLTDMFIVAIEEVAFNVGRIAPTLMIGVSRSLIEGFVTGIMDEVDRIGKFIQEVFHRVIGWVKGVFGIQSPSTVFLGIGKDIMQGLLNGVQSLIETVITFFKELPGKIIRGIGNVLSGVGSLFSKGKDVIQGLWNGVKDTFAWLMVWFGQTPTRIWNMLKGAGEWLIQIGKDIIAGLKQGLEDAWVGVKEWFEDKGDWIGDTWGWPKGLKFGSPSKLYAQWGTWMMQGLQKGLEKAWTPIPKILEDDADILVDAMSSIASRLYATIGDMDDLSPTIAPVLDLSKIRAGAKDINGLVAANAINADVSLSNARLISAVASARTDEVVPATAETREINFVQNNYSPKALSTNDIYRNSKSQIALAKEELGVA